MLIVLGGLFGSGRRALANDLALRSDFYHYDIDRKKLKAPFLNKKGEYRVRQPRGDSEQLRIYSAALDEFGRLSKMHDSMIVDDAFYREAPREYFLSGARKYYAPVIFVWVEADQESVRKNFERMDELGKISSVAGALRRRERTHAKLQPPAPSVPRFTAAQGDAKEVEELWTLIQETAKRSRAA